MIIKNKALLVRTFKTSDIDSQLEQAISYYGTRCIIYCDHVDHQPGKLPHARIKNIPTSSMTTDEVDALVTREKKQLPSNIKVLLYYDVIQSQLNNSDSGDDSIIDPNLNFDAEYYIQQNPDIAAAGFNTPELALKHFIEYGLKEGRPGAPPPKPLPVSHGKEFVIEPRYGLGNRLRAIASAYSISKYNEMKLIINWIPDIHCDCLLTDIFKEFQEENITVVNDPDLLQKYKNASIYNYINVEGGKYDETISTESGNDVYTISNCILNNISSHIYFEEFFKKLKVSDQIQTLLNQNIPENVSNCIGLHIRHGGGVHNQDNAADSSKNWTSEEASEMFKNRNFSHISNFIPQIDAELAKNPDSIFYVATDCAENYKLLLNTYGSNRIKYTARNIYDRSTEQMYYTLVDIITLSKCKKFYGSYWSSFSEIVGYLQPPGIQTIWSKDFTRPVNKSAEYNGKISVYHGCKNREKNLIQSIKSYIDNDIVDDIVIVDWGSTKSVKNFLKSKLKKKQFDKITVVETKQSLPWIASWANNIGLLFAKNQKILKLDADNVIIDHVSFFNKYSKIPLDTLVHFDWRDAKTKQEQHLNGIFFTSKRTLNLLGYHSQDIVFYGWEDEDIKVRHAYSDVVKIDSSFLKPVPQENKDRVIHQQNKYEFGTDFYGYDLSDFNELGPLICYNKWLLHVLNRPIVNDDDVRRLFKVKRDNGKHIEIEIVQKINMFNVNYNPTTSSQTSCCMYDVLPYFINEQGWVDTPVFSPLCSRYKIAQYQKTYVQFMMLCQRLEKYKTPHTVQHNKEIIISLYNVEEITRCVELLTCLDHNINNELIYKIHILYENWSTNPGESLIKDFIIEARNRNKLWSTKIQLVPVNKRPTYNMFFEYANKKIKHGNKVIL